jgi:hypothetical protein
VFGIHGARTQKVTYAILAFGIFLLINIIIVLVFVWLFPIVRLREPADSSTVRSL